LASHPDFQVLGADLYYPLPLTPWEAVLGTTVTIRSLDGDLQVRIPPSAVNGQKLRVRGKGLPKPKSEARGDLYVIAEIQMPTDVSPEERKLWEKLGQMSSFNPRA
jgi:curved DNA-binding protein